MRQGEMWGVGWSSGRFFLLGMKRDSGQPLVSKSHLEQDHQVLEMTIVGDGRITSGRDGRIIHCHPTVIKVS